MNSKVISNVSLNYTDVEAVETKAIPKVGEPNIPTSKENTKAYNSITVKLSFRRVAIMFILKYCMLLSVAFTVLLTVSLIGYIVVMSVPNINLDILMSKPSYLTEKIGILPDILNTVYIVIATLIMLIPIGVGAAIYLTEYAKNKTIVSIIEYTAETLSGIPSIIYGLVGMLFFCQFLSFGTSLLAGALTLVVMNLPTIMRTTQESLKTVPSSFRDSAFGLGAAKWTVIRTVVLPSCIDGIITGCILSVGRILGESAALLFTAGFAHALNSMFSALSNAGATLTVALYVYAKEQGEFEVAFVIAFILLVLSMLINLSTKFVGKAMKRKQK